MRILYTGPLDQWSTTEARRKALLTLVHTVIAVDSLPYMQRTSTLLTKLQWRWLFGPGVSLYNRDLLQTARECRPDVVWIDQGICVWPETVQAIIAQTGALLLHYTSEDVEHWRQKFRHYYKAVPLYDVHVTTNSLNIPFLRRLGARKVIRAEFGYDPDLHRPPVMEADELERYYSNAVFVGHWEPTTEETVLRLREEGLGLRVWGGGWKKVTTKSLLADKGQFHDIYGERYVKTLAGAKICLCFVSKWNRSQSSGRTFEIPAIGGFLLAERTDDHLSYYEEGKEAEYFLSLDELLWKARYYLTHEGERFAIARAGHERCLKSGYTHRDRVAQILGRL